MAESLGRELSSPNGASVYPPFLLLRISVFIIVLQVALAPKEGIVLVSKGRSRSNLCLESHDAAELDYSLVLCKTWKQLHCGLFLKDQCRV